MRKLFFAVIVSSAGLLACPSNESAPTGDDSVPAAPAAGSAAASTEAAPAAPTEVAPAAPAANEPDSLVAGVYKSPKFNIQFTVPEGWRKLEVGASDGSAAALPGVTASNDSLTFVGPEGSGIRLVIANTQSVQLVGTSFASLDDRIGFDNVNILPEKSEGRTFNGVPGYRTEGDALVRGEGTPVYFIAQALELPGKPTMVTIFIPGTLYFEHSATMKAVLDSIEVLNLRPQ